MSLTRRSALASAGLLAAAACTSSSPTKRATPVVDPDVALRAAAVERERALLVLYHDSLALSTSLKAKLTPLLADHEAHLAALGGVAHVPDPGTADLLHVTPAALLQRLRAAEHTAGTAHAAAALTASRELAALLGSLAACEASARGRAVTETAALTAALEAEHAALYGYGVLGARLDDATRTIALTAYDAHRVLRDRLASALRARKQVVPGPAASYVVTVAGRPQALALAVRLETDLAVSWRDLLSATDEQALRRLSVQAMQDCAVRATRWRQLAGVKPLTQALPGTV